LLELLKTTILMTAQIFLLCTASCLSTGASCYNVTHGLCLFQQHPTRE